jgi:hypothetical protein
VTSAENHGRPPPSVSNRNSRTESASIRNLAATPGRCRARTAKVIVQPPSARSSPSSRSMPRLYAVRPCRGDSCRPVDSPRSTSQFTGPVTADIGWHLDRNNAFMKRVTAPMKRITGRRRKFESAVDAVVVKLGRKCGLPHSRQRVCPWWRGLFEGRGCRHPLRRGVAFGQFRRRGGSAAAGSRSTHG